VVDSVSVEVSSNEETPGSIKPLIWWLLIVGLILFRLIGLGDRPLHNDEGVNYFFIGEIHRLGYYPYSHENYHGPLYFYFLWLCNLAPQVGEFWLRFPSVVLGLAVFLPILLVRKILPGKILFWIVALAGLSASQVFYQRYAIHEPLFLTATSLVAFSLFAWHRTRAPSLHLWTGLGIGALLSTKETWIVSLFCLWFAFWSLGDWRSVVRDLLKQKVAIAQGTAIIVLLVVLTFSGGGLWSGGLREMLLAIPQWVDRGHQDTGHFKPFWYYLWMMIGEHAQGVPTALSATKGTVTGVKLGGEWYVWALLPLILLLGWRGLAASKLRLPLHADRGSHTSLFLRFTAVWSLLSFLVYSAIKYKTPWLVINLSFPLAVFIVVAVLAVIQSSMRQAISLGILSSLAALQAYTFCFAIPYGGANPYSYVHSSPGLLDFVRDVQAFYARDNHKDDDRVLLAAVPQYWPLPFYLRPPEYNVHYQTTIPSQMSELSKFDIMLLPPEHPRDYPGYVHRYYRLSDVQESEVYFRSQAPVLK
jgi:uncharacterized protein (TIGR03663 family)